MKLIVAVSKDWGIGKDNKLLFSLKEDMKFFKATTTGKVVVMGKNTYLSLPKRPLKDRVNIVLSSNEQLENCIQVCNLDQLFAEIGKYDQGDVFVIGGAAMYRQLLPYCSEAFITKVDSHANADAFFPNLDEDNNWECVSEKDAQDVLPIKFCLYKNKNVIKYTQKGE